MFETKKVKDLKSLIKEAYSYLSNYEFDKALVLYNKINGKLELLPKKDKTDKLKRDVDNINKGMILYLRLNEAAVIIDKNDLTRLRELLDLINDSVNEIRLNMPEIYDLVKYGKKYLILYTDTYNSRYYSIKFRYKYNDILRLIRERRISEATKQYYVLLGYYKELIKYEDVSKIRPKLNSLLQDIEINKLLDLAHEKVKPRKIIKLEMQEEEPYVPRTKVRTSRVVKFDPLYNEIHDLLKDNKYKEASNLFENV